MSRPRVRHPWVLVVAGAVLVGSGLVLTGTGSRADAPDFGPSVAAAPAAGTGPDTPAPSASPAPGPPVPPPAVLPTAPRPAPVVPAAPVSVTLPADADAVPLVPVGVLPGGGLELPERPTVLGWYAGGAVPGDAAGTAVVAGHIDSAVYGAGPLEGLFALEPGDPVTVTDEAGQAHAYVVSARTAYPKSALPPELFRTDGPPQLALVTCGGDFDERTGSYADNVVVLAVPAPAG